MSERKHPEWIPSTAEMVAAVGEEHAAFWLACGVSAREAAVLSETFIGGRAQRHAAWEWLGALEIAALLNVPLQHLANMYAAGRIPTFRTHYRHGRGARVRDIMRWLAGGVSNPDRKEEELDCVPLLLVGLTGGDDGK